jgi:excisionase family DNA binding protein
MSVSPVPPLPVAPLHWLTVAEAAAHLRVKPRTILLWAKRGHIPAHPLHGGKRITWRFLAAELDAVLLESNCGSVLTPVVRPESEKHERTI